MAVQVIEEYLPKTAAYINHVFDINGIERGGHHNYVIEQKICNLDTSIANQCSENVQEIDDNLLDYLKYLDTTH